MLKKKSKFKIIKCPRCGKNVTTITSPITGAIEAYNKFKGICSQCVTPQEEMEILNAQAKAIQTLALNRKTMRHE